MKPGDIHETIASWTEEPERASARIEVSARSAGAQAVIDSGLFSWWSDFPPSLGGSGQAPSPLTLLLSSIASCAVIFARNTLAPQLGVDVADVQASIRCDTDYRGLVDLDGVAPGLDRVELEIRVTSRDEEAAVVRLFDVWKERSPVLLALAKGLEIDIALVVERAR